jgi:pimeloyl-ACP methyl ester carboxylesterase
MFRIRPLIYRAMRWWKQGLPCADAEWEKLFLLCLLDGSSQNRVFPAVFTDDELKKSSTPTMLLVGDREVIYSREKTLERAARLVPGIRAEIIPSANHIPSASNPQWLSERVLQFLQQ